MQFSKFNEVEVAIYFLYLLGEIIPVISEFARPHVSSMLFVVFIFIP